MAKWKKKSPKVKDKLSELEVRPSKERGQNFLIDDSVIKAIVDFGSPKASERIIEIGPGLGALTAELVKVGPVTAIEIEEKFCDELIRKFENIEVLHGDVRDVDFSELGNDLVIFGNLPYVFSTDIIFRLVDFAANVKRAVLLLQREFAERLASDPGGRTYGTLSISAQLWADVRLGPIIPGTSFHPPAKVESALVELTFLKVPRYAVNDLYTFKRVVKASFLQRRRMLHNSLKSSGLWTGDEVDEVLSLLGIDPSRRAETLSVEEYVKLANEFGSRKKL